MQSASSRIYTWVTWFFAYDNNSYKTSAFQETCGRLKTQYYV